MKREGSMEQIKKYFEANASYRVIKTMGELNNDILRALPVEDLYVNFDRKTLRRAERKKMLARRLIWYKDEPKFCYLLLENIQPTLAQRVLTFIKEIPSKI